MSSLKREGWSHLSITGSQTFTLTHQYLDDNPTATSQDRYMISAIVTDDHTLSGVDTTTVLVNDVAPTLTLDTVAMTDEHGAATLTGTIDEPSTLDTFILDVDWGNPLSPNNTYMYIFAASVTPAVRHSRSRISTWTITVRIADARPLATHLEEATTTTIST